MKKIYLFLFVLLLTFAFSACNESTETAIYTDENGSCDFGAWAERGFLDLNSIASFYLMDEDGINSFLKEAYMEGTVTAEEQKKNWETILVTYALLSDEDLMRYSDADEEGVKKFRAYAEDHLTAAIEAEKNRDHQEHPYLDEAGNYNIGDSWEIRFKEGLEQAMTLYHATPEEIIQFSQDNPNTAVYDAASGEPIIDPEELRENYGFTIINISATFDKNLMEMYGATAEDIARFRTYYATDFINE